MGPDFSKMLKLGIKEYMLALLSEEIKGRTIRSKGTSFSVSAWL